VVGFCGNSFSLKNPQRKKSQGLRFGLLGGHNCMHGDQDTDETKVVVQEVQDNVCCVAPSSINHCVFNGKPVAISRGTKLLCNMLK
jgi:hypothetical protein